MHLRSWHSRRLSCGNCSWMLICHFPMQLFYCRISLIPSEMFPAHSLGGRQLKFRNAVRPEFHRWLSDGNCSWRASPSMLDDVQSMSCLNSQHHRSPRTMPGGVRQPHACVAAFFFPSSSSLADLLF